VLKLSLNNGLVRWVVADGGCQMGLQKVEAWVGEVGRWGVGSADRATVLLSAWQSDAIY